MRDLYSILEEILTIIKNDVDYEQYENGLKSIQTSVTYSPPEYHGLWWRKANAFILGSIIDTKLLYSNMDETSQQILRIWSTKTHDELLSITTL